MAEKDIDKILRDIKKRKEMSQQAAVKPEVKQQEQSKTEDVTTAFQRETAKADNSAAEKAHGGLSDRGKQTLADFINNSLPENDGQDTFFGEIDAAGKKSEDYIDENFMNFFTSSVIVTKGPGETKGLNIKRKKGSFLRRGYVTDSLSLNIEKLEDEEKKRAEKEKRRLEKEAAKAVKHTKDETAEQSAPQPAEEKEGKLTFARRRKIKKEQARKRTEGLPIVKTAGDVWAEQLEKDQHRPEIVEPEQTYEEKPAKEKFSFKKRDKKPKAEKGEKGIGYIFGHDEGEEEEPAEEISAAGIQQPAAEIETVKKPTPVKDKPVTKEIPAVKDIPAKEITPQPEAPAPKAEGVKVYTPKANPQSLSSILADDKDPESIAARILRQRKAGGTAAAVTAATAVALAEKPRQPELPSLTVTAEDKPVDRPAKTPTEEDGIIGSIYTSIIEKQAREALATEEMTGFIPEFEDTEEETKSVPVILQEDEPEEEIFEEYISKSEFLEKNDQESRDIQSELASFRQTLNLRIFLGFATGLILTYFNLAAASSLPMPRFIAPKAQPLMYAAACLAVYAIAFVGFLPTVISGFKSLTDSPAPDSFVSLGAVLAMLQIVVMCVFSETTDMTKITVFAAFICIALAFNALGKRISTNTILKNLTLANAPSGINAGYIVNDTDRVKRLARTLDEKLPKVLVSRKTGQITNFVNAGFSIHNSDYTARKVALAGYGVTAVCFVMGFVVSKNFASAVYSAAGAAALMIPLSHTLVNSVPSALMQKTLEKVGALVNGWQGIDQLARTTHVNFDARHLFPRGTVILHGIKTFEKERIDLAILYAASVLIKECEVLKPVFMEVIDGKTDILPAVDSCEYIELQGYISWINDNRVIIGNRTLMEQYDVDMPPVSMETKFINQGRKPVYLAVGGKLFGMFVFSYRADEIVKENLERLMDKGVSIILSSKDFNIDPHLIQTVYGIPSDYISVLNRREANLLARFTDYSEGSECCVAHLDSLSSLVAGFRGAESAGSREKVCSIIQTISVAIGAVLAVMFTWSQTIMSLPLLSVLLLSFGFMGIAMLTAVAKKYE